MKIGQKIYLDQPYFQVVENRNNEIKDKSYIEHLVIQGETMYSISRFYGVSIKKIVEWNKKSGHSIREGEKLIIYKEY
ncbi:LysM peptidoglycan-binding domain-containing protein [Bacteroidota bacterium]